MSGHEIIKGFGGTVRGKLLRYYGTKALRSNRKVGRLYYADRKVYRRVSKPELQDIKRIDTALETNYNSNMMNYKSETLRKNRTFFTKSKILEKVVKRVQDDKSHFPRPQGRGCHEVTGEGLSDKSVSEAHRNHKPHLTHSTHVKRVAFTLAEGATHVDMSDNIRRVAFTLAEVLITLGIIGIVAVMTIPTLVANYQKKVLKTQFAKKYAEISQAVLLAKSETNGNFKEYCIKYDGTSFFNEPECKAMFDKYFKETGTCVYKDDVLTYDKKRSASVNAGAVTAPKRLLSDGSCYDMKVNAYQLGFTFDMNGPDKGPNALGHDIFSFWLDDNDYLQPIKQSTAYSEDELESAMQNCLAQGYTPSTCASIWNQRGYPCTKNSSQTGNGLGCSWFAFHDECPDDDTKGYWDCLPK